MTPLDTLLSNLSDEVATLSGRIGRRVEADRLGLMDRSPFMALGPAGGSVSPNGSCRLFRTGDGGWVALNLARPDDLDLLPAWLETDVPPAAPWRRIEALAARRTTTDLLQRAALLGLPAARVGEAAPYQDGPPALRFAAPSPRRPEPPRVVDLSALWAGPLCGALFAGLGAEVVRIESRRRDPTQDSTPALFQGLNGAKARLALDFDDPADRAELRRQVQAADVLITSARPRAFSGLGLEPETVFAGGRSLVWIAITAHGWTGDGACRVGFGDDTAAAGGLVGSSPAGAPTFLGDALADPITGLMAAAAGVRALEQGGGVLVDMAMSRCAATAAASLAIRSAA
jgi:hypothetical protein